MLRLAALKVDVWIFELPVVDVKKRKKERKRSQQNENKRKSAGKTSIVTRVVMTKAEPNGSLHCVRA